MQTGPERNSCPVCGSTEATDTPSRYAEAPWRLLQCSRCSMVWLQNPPTVEMLEEDLAWEKTFAAEGKARRARNPVLYKLGRMPKAALQKLLKRDKLLDLVSKYVAPGPILDVGCAGGHTLAGFPTAYIPYGVEISKELSRVANEIFAQRGGSAMQGDAPTAMGKFPRGHFNGALMGSYLEHEPRAAEVLKAARQVMHPGARLILKVPNYACWNRELRGKRWCGFRFPDHVNYFTPATLVQLLQATGFKVVRFGIADRMPTSDNMWLVAEAAEAKSAAAA